MPNVGTITGSMYLDPSAYVSGLTGAAGSTRAFQQQVNGISFSGFNRGIFATTTLLYGLERVMSNMSKGMEEYANMLGRIGTVADLTASSVSALADSMKQISVYQGVSRKDIMGGMYTAAQAGYESPAEMRAMASAGARLSRASGKEIDVKKSVDLQSGIRQALGIGMDSVTSNRMNDILLRGRDIGRWELDQMAHALGIPLTVWGNQYAGKQSGEETLRQLLSVMSVASLAGVSPNMTATGTRRIVEKTLQLNKSGRVGDPLRNALKGEGFSGPNGIMDALNQGGIQYLNTLMKITGGGQTSELTRLGYGSRDLLVLTSALRGRGEKLNQTYEELSYGNAAGTTERYGEKMRQTYDYSRDRLRAQWEITSQQFMQASIPLISVFTNMLEGFNKVAQSLPESVKSFTMLLGALVSMRLFMTLLGFRNGTKIVPGMGSLPGLAGSSVAIGGSSAKVAATNWSVLPAAQAQAERLSRMQKMASVRPWSRSTYATPQASMSWSATNAISQSPPPSSLAAMPWMARQPKNGVVEDDSLEALRNRYAPITSGGIPVSSSRYGPSTEARIAYAAYKHGESVNFQTGSYGSLSPTAQAYFANRGKDSHTLSTSQMRKQILGYGNAEVGISGAIVGNIGRQIGEEYATPSISRQMGRYVGARGVFSTASVPANGAMYGSMGVNTMSRVLGEVTSGLTAFSAGIGRVLKPLALFSGTLVVLSSLYEGLTYNSSKEEKVGGLVTTPIGGSNYNGLTAIPHQLRFAAAGWFNKDGVGDMARDFGRKYGAVADGSGNGWNRFEAWMKTGTGAMAGYRDATMNDVLGISAREQFSPGAVTRLRKQGFGFENFDKAKPIVETYMREQLGTEPPQNWNEWLLSAPDAIEKGSQLIADAFKFSAKQIADAGSKSASEILRNRQSDKLDKYTRQVPGYIGFSAGNETLANLESGQKKPFEPEKSTRWMTQYQKALGAYFDVWGNPQYRSESIRGDLSGIEREIGKSPKKNLQAPFKNALDLNEKLNGASFLAQNGPKLRDSKSVTDEMLISNLGIDTSRMTPQMTKSILGQIRGLDYTQWTQTFEQEKAPFSQALQYGTKEGYNATLERRETDPVVQIMGTKLTAVVDAIVATTVKDDEKLREFKDTLDEIIKIGTQPIVDAINLSREGFPNTD